MIRKLGMQVRPAGQTANPLCHGCTVVLLFLSLPANAFAQSNTAGEKPTPPPLVIQSVPVTELPKFLSQERPVRRSAFEDFIRSNSQGANVDSVNPELAMVSQATYEARFNSDGKLEGSARVSFLNRAQQPILFPTPNFGVAIHAPRWKDRNDAVQWGLAPDGRMMLLLPESGELQFEWSAEAAFFSERTFQFEIAFFQAVQAKFEVVTPSNWNAKLQPEASAKSSENQASTIRHTFDVGSATRVRLSVQNKTPIANGQPSCWIRQFSKLDITRQGIDYVCDLDVEPTADPLSTLVLRTDGALQVVSAMMGDQILPWTIRTDGDSQYIELKFDPPVVETGRRIRVDARAALVSSSIASLPRVRPPKECWREEELEIHTASPLELVGLELSDARVSDSGPAVSGRGGETRNFRLYSPDGDIRCAFRTPEFRGRVRHAAQLSASESTFELAGGFRVQVDSGETFELTANIPAGWLVDQIESDPPEAIENWSVSAQESQQKLALRLSKAINSKTPLQFRITSHIPRVSPAPLASNMLNLANFDQLQNEAGFLRLRAAGGIQVEASSTATSIDQASVSAGDLELFPSASTGEILSFTPKDNFSIIHAASETKLSVESTARILMEPARISVWRRLAVTPSQGPIDRLVMRIHPATGEEVSFGIENTSGKQVRGSLIKSGEEGDEWEVRFPEPRSGAFVLTALENGQVAQSGSIRILHCDGASAQDSMLRIFAQDHEAWEISASGVQSLPSDPSAPSSLSELAAFRHGRMDRPQIVYRKKNLGTAATRLWAWRERRITIIGEEDEDVHEASFILESTLPQIAQFQLPRDLRLKSILLDGELQTGHQQAGETLRIPVTGSNHRQTLQIRFASHQTQNSMGVSPLVWRGPTAAFTVLTRDWTIWKPPSMGIAYYRRLGFLETLLSLAETADPAFPSLSASTAINSAPSAQEHSNAIDANLLSAEGWTAVFIRDVPSPTILRYRSDVWRLAGWTALILAFLGFQCLSGVSRARRRGIVFVVMMMCTIGVLVSPMPWMFLPFGVLMGGVLALLFAASANTRFSLPVPMRGWRVVSRGVLIGMVFIAAMPTTGIQAPAQSPQEQVGESKFAPQRNVFDPVDGNGKPTGDFVYVSPGLFEEIALATPVRAEEACLLKEVRYRTSRFADPQTASLQVSVEYLYSSSADSVFVPLIVDATNLVPTNEEYYVDGDRRRVTASEAARTPQLELVGQGVHTVRFDAQIPIRVINGVSIATWRTPRVPSQKLEVETDASLVWALDGRTLPHDPASQLATVALPPEHPLQLSLKKAVSPAPAAESSLKHEVWFSVTPGSMTAEHLIKLAPGYSRESLLLELDDTVQLDSIIGDDRRTLIAAPLGERRFRVPIESRSNEESTLRIQTLMKSRPVAGRISSVGITFPESKVTTSHVAVSVSPDLIAQAESRPGVSEMLPATFAQSWPAGKPLPAIAIAVESNRAFGIDIRSHAPSRSAIMQSEFLCRPSNLMVQMDAEISSAGQALSIYSMKLPEDMRIESVVVVEGSSNRLVRFARTTPTLITIFMKTASQEARRIRVRGSIAFEGERPLKLPQMTFENTDIVSHTISIFRGYDAQVEITNAAEMKFTDLQAESQKRTSVLEPQNSRLIAAFEAPTAAQSWETTVAIKPNQPDISHESIARFDQKDSRWTLTQTFQFNIQNGVVDQLELELPPGIREPVQLSPKDAFQIVRVEGANAQLRILPASPWKESQELQIAADYVVEDATLIPVRVARSRMQSGFISAPKQSGAGEFTWQGEHCDPITAPAEIPNSSAFQWFQERTQEIGRELREEASLVRLKRSQSESMKATVRLEGELFVRGSEFAGSLIWFWDTTPLNEVMITAPPSVRVVRARVIGSSSHVTQVGDRRWRMTSGLGAAPPTLEIVCAGEVMLEEPITLPFINAQQIKETRILLTVPERLSPKTGAELLAKRDNSLLFARLKLLDQVRRDAGTVLPTLGEQESLLWRRNWLTQWDRARNQLPLNLETDSSTQFAQLKWLREADADRARFAEAIGDAAGNRVQGEEPAVALLASALSMNDEPNAIAHCSLGEGEMPSISFRERSNLTLIASRIWSVSESAPGIVLGLAAGLLAAILLLTSSARRAMALKIAPVGGWTVLAIICWIWLSPSWIGAFLAGVAILTLLGAVFGRRTAAA
jgi:hypothetical protein